MTKNLLLAVLVGVLTLAARAAPAAWPEKPILMIVAFGAGGATDVTARSLAPFIEKHLPGARILVLNKPGATGEIGFAAIADAAPDGYTIGFINPPGTITIPLEREARFSPDRLDPLVNIVDDPAVMTVHADSPIRSLADLVAHAKANPGAVTVGTTGVGSDDQIAMLLLQRQAGVTFAHVPFPGSAESRRAMMNRQIVVTAHNLGEALRSAETDPVRILGVMSPTRTALAPDLPTFREQGFDIVLAAMRGIAAPVGLPPDIRARLVEAITRAAEDPEFQAKAHDTFQPLRVLGPAAFAAAIKEQEVAFTALWRETPWR